MFLCLGKQRRRADAVVFAQLISAIVFVIQVVPFTLFPSLKFQIYNCLAWVVSDLVGNPKSAFVTIGLVSFCDAFQDSGSKEKIMK